MSVKPHFDKYDVAGVFVYLLRAKLPRSLYEPDTFFLAAYLLNLAQVGMEKRWGNGGSCGEDWVGYWVCWVDIACTAGSEGDIEL